MIGVRIENLSFQEFIINIGENLENTNKDQEGASPRILSRVHSARSVPIPWCGSRKFRPRGKFVHTEVTGDTGQWTSRHWQADELNTSNRWAGTNTYIIWVCGSLPKKIFGRTTFIFFPLVQDSGIDFSWIEDSRGL